MLSFSKELNDLLETYSKEVQEAVDEETQASAKKAVQELKANSPKRTGAYARSWASKKEGHGYIVHNKKHYQLTHLLENGHLLFSYGKARGRVPAKVHIAPVADKVGRDFVTNTQRRLSK